MWIFLVARFGMILSSRDVHKAQTKVRSFKCPSRKSEDCLVSNRDASRRLNARIPTLETFHLRIFEPLSSNDRVVSKAVQIATLATIAKIYVRATRRHRTIL